MKQNAGCERDLLMGFSFIWSESLDHVDKFHPNLSSFMKKQKRKLAFYMRS